MAGFDFDEIPEDNSEDREKLICVQTQAIERLETPEARAAFEALREKCAKRWQFDAARGERVAVFLGSLCEQYEVDLEWLFTAPGALFPEDAEVQARRAQVDELTRFCDPGPSGLDKNDCVEVQGLESESGKPNNGKKAVVIKWLVDKGRYEVRIASDKLLTLKPENVRKLGELEKLRCVQKQAVEILSAKEAQRLLDEHRGKASNAMQYAKLKAESLPQLITPACEHHGVDLACAQGPRWPTEKAFGGWPEGQPLGVLKQCGAMAGLDTRLLERAAEAGHAEAQCALGTAFLMGDGVPRDAGRAAALFERAAAQGDARAQCNLGAMYAQGMGVDQDFDQARSWYEKSAEQGNPDGQYNLAVVYAQALGGCKKDMAKARDLCERAAAQGQEKAQALLRSLAATPAPEPAAPAKSAPPGTTRVGRAGPELGAAGAGGPSGAAELEERLRQVREVVEGLGGEGAEDEKVRPYRQLLQSLEQAAAAGGAAPGPAPVSSASRSPAAAPAAHRDYKRVCFGQGQPLELRGELGPCWRGTEAEAAFPKPGPGGGCRRLHLLERLASEEEVAGILQFAQNSLEFNVDNDSVDQKPTFERNVMQVGQYVHDGLERFLKPIVEERLLPYVRRKFAAPDAVVCTALLRRYLPDERRVHPTHLDGHALCTAVLGLNAGEFEGGLYVQPEPDARRREFVELGRGDLAVHQYDLPHGVRVFGGRRYSLIFWIKDCMHSCVTNATPWYAVAATAGDPDAMTALAQKLNMGMNREGLGSDPVRAAELYAKAAEMGQAEAQTNLGVFYETGRGGLPVDGSQAVRWWRRAAEVGDAGAQRLLALAHAAGTCGLARSETEAVRWMTKAAEQDDWEAMHWLSLYYGPGAHEELDKALEWLRRAAEMGHPEAQCGLGSAHLMGEGVQESMELAAMWFRRAAFNGNASAQCNLGAFYAQGLGGLQQDFGQALRWYRASAEQANPDGQHNLALMYAQGLGGLPRDLSAAREWGEKAAAQGHEKAVMMLRALDEESEEAQCRVEELDDDGDRVEELDDVEELPAPATTAASEVPGHSRNTTVSTSTADKAEEVRELLADVRKWNASQERARALVDGLLARVDALRLTSSGAASPTAFTTSAAGTEAALDLGMPAEVERID